MLEINGGLAAKLGVKAGDKVKAGFMDGSFSIFKGPIKDNKGNVVIPAGTTVLGTDISLESMNYLVEGVLGSTS